MDIKELKRVKGDKLAKLFGVETVLVRVPASREKAESAVLYDSSAFVRPRGSLFMPADAESRQESLDSALARFMNQTNWVLYSRGEQEDTPSRILVVVYKGKRIRRGRLNARHLRTFYLGKDDDLAGLIREYNEAKSEI